MSRKRLNEDLKLKMAVAQKNSSLNHSGVFLIANVFFFFRSECAYSQLNHDVGLIKLAAPVMLNDFVNTICLPSQSVAAPVNTKCYITGRYLVAVIGMENSCYFLTAVVQELEKVSDHFTMGFRHIIIEYRST